MAFEFKLPSLGEGIEAVDIVRVLVAPGEVVQVEQAVLELETEKASIELPSPVAGAVAEIKVREGDKAKVGELMMTIEDNGAVAAPSPAAEEAEAPPPPAAAPPVEAPAPEAELPAPTPSVPGNPVPATPTVRRLAREIGVDISQVQGTSQGGRISADDVKRHAKARLTSGASPAATDAAVPAVPSLPDFSQWGEVESVPLSNIRRTTAARLSHTWRTVPQVTQFDKADITDLDQQRRAHAKKAEAAGGKLTITAILTKVVAAALRRFPQFNVSLDMAGDRLVQKRYCHIGIAVDTDRGLIVPVIRDADQKNIIELAVELGQLAARARDKKTTLDEMKGGCFTITNLGGIGGTDFTPILNWPEVAILGVARGAMEPRWQDGEFVPRLMLPLALSYDHRVIDGADGARFLRWIADALEQPFLLALEG